MAAIQILAMPSLNRMRQRLVYDLYTFISDKVSDDLARRYLPVYTGGVSPNQPASHRNDAAPWLILLPRSSPSGEDAESTASPVCLTILSPRHI